MDKKDRQYVIESSLKALITFIPGIGGAIGSILSDALADRKEERLNIFLQDLKSEIDNNREAVNKTFVSKTDFLDVFDATANKIANERSAEKRNAYKNILLNGILSPSYTYDDLENQMRTLSVLNEDHILLLKFFNSPQAFSEKSKSLKTGTFLQFFKQILPHWENDYLKDILNDLEVNRLINNISNNLQTMIMNVSADHFTDTLTSKGKTFVSFILR
ncbi:MAG: hypothetical protein J7621_15690 [Niastella sp.]|nr:hypothetical protein [Niastella sp.]